VYSEPFGEFRAHAKTSRSVPENRSRTTVADGCHVVAFGSLATRIGLKAAKIDTIKSTLVETGISAAEAGDLDTTLTCFMSEKPFRFENITHY
jgi:hypothetical protein